MWKEIFDIKKLRFFVVTFCVQRIHGALKWVILPQIIAKIKYNKEENKGATDEENY